VPVRQYSKANVQQLRFDAEDGSSAIARGALTWILRRLWAESKPETSCISVTQDAKQPQIQAQAQQHVSRKQRISDYGPIINDRRITRERFAHEMLVRSTIFRFLQKMRGVDVRALAGLSECG